MATIITFDLAAGDEPRPAPAPPPRQTHDGFHVTLGPLGSVTHVDGAWTTGAGAELSLLNVRESALVAAWGVALGGTGYTAREGGRLWCEAEMAFYRPLPFPVGLGLGATAEVDNVRPARFGAQGTLWFFLGIVPYVRGGVVADTGAFFEAGLMLKLPVIHVL